MITEDKKRDLLELAENASNNSYSPYSNFKVGSCILTESGAKFVGTNIENASYGLTICAERVAICTALTLGYKNFIAIAVFTKNKNVLPCGACRQFIIEFGEDIEIIYENENGIVSKLIKDLLPSSFSKSNLI